MVQSAVRQGGRVKSTRQDAAVSTNVRSGRGKHNRARSDPIQYQEDTPVSGSLSCVDDSSRMVTRTRHRAVTGDSHSSHQPQKTKRTASAKAAVKQSAKPGICKHLRPGNNVDYLEKATVLLDWIIKPLPDIRGVCVEGQKQGMADYWHSAAIVEAVRTNVVVTATGSIYKLQGKINKYCTIDNGFPQDVAKAFRKGFPHNWNEVIQDFYRQLEDSISIVAEISPLKGQRLQQRTPRHKLVKTARKTIVAEISPLKDQRLQQRTPCHKLVKTASKRKTPAASSQKLDTPDRVQDSIWTPAGLLKQKLSTDDVTVTRSGRISLPPLASWTGQCYKRIPNSSDFEVTFETDCAKKTLHNTTAQLLQLPKRSRKMIYNSSLSKSFQPPADSCTNVIDCKLNQTVVVLANIDECWPVASAGASRKKALVTGSRISVKVDGVPSGADEDTRHTVNKSAERVSATANPHFQLTSNRNSRSHNLANMSQPSPADNGAGGMLGTVQESARHSRGLLTRDSTDVHAETTLDKSLRVILSRNLPGDANTQAQKLTKQTTRPLNTEHGSRPVRRSGRGVHKYSSTSSSNVDSDSTFLQSADSSQTGVNNKSDSQRVRGTQTKQRLPAGNRDSRSRESSNSCSSERHFHRQKQGAAMTRSKKTEVTRLPAGGRSVPSGRKSDSRPTSESGRKSDSRPTSESGCKSHSRPTSESGRKSDSRPLSESGKKGLQADMKPAATAAGSAKSRHLTTSSQAAAGQGQPVSTTRKRPRDEDDDVLKADIAGNNTIVDRKSRKRRKVMDVASSGHVSWSQQEKDLLHRALKEVSGAASSYWQKVSAVVATRSQAECQQYYRQYLEGRVNKTARKPSNTRQQHKDKKGRKKGDPIRGGKGTLKRKQDLREFLQEQNEGYEDNLFEGTSFVNRHKQSSLFTVNVDKNDSEIFGVNHNCITPVAGTSTVSTPAAFLRAKMVSVKKTPLSDHVTVLDDTPVTFNRRKADQYIKSFMNRQKKAEPGLVVVKEEESVLNLSNLPVRSLFSPATHPYIVIDSHSTNTAEEEEEEEKSPYMYYWNDES